MSGTPQYHEHKLLSLVEDIQLVETIQNFLPVVPSPILQELFKQTAYRHLNSLDYNLIISTIELFIDVLEDDISSQDLYIPYMACVNIWNNLIFGNLYSVESLLGHVYQVLHTKKFWKKFDSIALSLWEDYLIQSMGNLTRYMTRVILRYLGEKSLKKNNKISFNRINDVWENVFTDFDEFNLNTHLENSLHPVLDGRTRTFYLLGAGQTKR